MLSVFMKQKLAIIAWMAALALTASAQSTMRVHHKDGTKSDYPIAYVDSITFLGTGNAASSKIMIVPDIQHYTDNEANLSYLDAIVDYYSSHQDNFAGCFQVGDVTNNNQEWQWTNAYNHFFQKFSDGKEPYFCLGNHDYGENGKSGTRSSNIPNEIRPVMDFQKDDCRYENYVRYIYVRGEKYAVLDLEFAPRNSAIAWADSVIASDTDTPFIILTHVFLNKYAEMYDATDTNVFNKASQKQYTMGGEYVNDSREIFDKLIYKHSNIKLIICGHSLTPNYIDVKRYANVKGDDVFCVMVNYQHFTSGGQGNVGILEFRENGYRVRSFSAVEGSYGSIDITF